MTILAAPAISQALGDIGQPSSLAHRWGLSDDKLRVVRSVIAPGAPDDILDLYFELCRGAGADPFSKMIYAINRPSKARSGERSTRQDGKVDRWTFQSSIDLFRSIADSSDKYAGQVGPFWCGKDGVWTDVWLQSGAPAAAKVGVRKHGFPEPLWSVAVWKSYAQTDWDGNVTGLWKTHSDVMLAKCAEALALRKAFPQRLHGLYTSDEMAQAGTPQAESEQPAASAIEEANISPVVALPVPAVVQKRPKSAAELKAMFDGLGLGISFLDWIAETIAPDIMQRKKRVMTVSEAALAEAEIGRLIDSMDGGSDSTASSASEEAPAEGQEAPETTTLLQAKERPAKGTSTPAQHAAIRKLVKSLDWDQADVEAHLQSVTAIVDDGPDGNIVVSNPGTRSFYALTVDEAILVIAGMQEELDSRPPGNEP